MLIGRAALCDLIPHAGSMCLLDGVQQWDAEQIVCTSHSHLDKNNPLRKNGRLSSLHALEYGAQAMAVHGGLLAQQRGEQAPPGYLAALRDARLLLPRLDNLDGPLVVTATQLMVSAGNLMYTLRVESQNQLVASARATVITQQQHQTD